MSNPVIVNQIYHEDTIHVNNAKPIFEPHHFTCAIEESEIEFVPDNVETLSLKPYLKYLFCIFCLLIMGFCLFIFITSISHFF